MLDPPTETLHVLKRLVEQAMNETVPDTSDHVGAAIWRVLVNVTRL
jgi:hypothetical protein